MSIKSSIKGFLADESGASLAEYALLIGVLVVAVVGAIAAFRNNVTNAFNNAGNEIQNPQ
jgi:pilus assembly protein Flp/PilA